MTSFKNQLNLEVVLDTNDKMVNEYIEEIFVLYKDLIGKDYQAYRNHVHRIVLLTLSMKTKILPDDEHKLAIAAVYHDIGIWTAKTFDYLVPSIAAATTYLIEKDL